MNANEHKIAGPPDPELLCAARQGDQGAFSDLVTRYRPRIYALAYRVTLDEDDALDVTQDTSVMLCRKINQLRADRALWSWLRTATVNCCMDLFRRRQRERERLQAHGRDLAPLVDPGESIVAVIQRGQLLTRVERAMTELSRQQRLVFSLRYHEERPLAEIAEMTGLQIGSVKSHLFRATRRLKQLLGVSERSGEEIG